MGASSSVMAIAVFVLAFFCIVAFHELGHFLAAKRAGITVLEFGICFPPRIFAIKRGDTEYSLNLIPLGAFVKTVGENDPSVLDGLASKSAWTRMGVFAAGPMANGLLAFLLFTGYFMMPVDTISGEGIMVSSVNDGSPAEEAGILPGDVLLKIEETEIHNREDIGESLKDGEPVDVLVQRGDEQFEVNIQPEHDQDEDRYLLGVFLCWGIVTDIQDGSPANEAGIEVGDTILTVGGRGVYSSDSLSNALGDVDQGEKVVILLLSEGEAEEVELVPQPDGIGVETEWVTTSIESQRYHIWDAFYLGGKYMVNLPVMIADSFVFIRDQPDRALVGPLGAGQLTVEVINSFGYDEVISIAALLSLGIGLFNLLPIPPLDGGGMLVALIEGVRRGKRLSPRAMQLAYTIGTVFMISVFIAIMYGDIARLIRGESFL
ncbi:MAG: RIP metalloprotease RseP [Chloroflexota bacterium]|nr:RIP metalloprotease RseP [Chloroflexota bacterium]